MSYSFFVAHTKSLSLWERFRERSESKIWQLNYSYYSIAWSYPATACFVLLWWHNLLNRPYLHSFLDSLMLEMRYLLLEMRHLLLEMRHLLLEMPYLLLEMRYLLLEMHHLLLEMRHLLLEMRHLLLEMHYLLLEMHHFLLEMRHLLLEMNHLLLEMTLLRPLCFQNYFTWIYLLQEIENLNFSLALYNKQRALW